MLLGLQLAVALGEQQGAGLDAPGQVAALPARVAVGFAVFQWAGMLFTQAQGFAQPEALQAGGRGLGSQGHAAVRWWLQA
ncbi:hypothetical protein D3C78_1926760 [compost metagenome]